MRDNKNIEIYMGSLTIDYKRELIRVRDGSAMETGEIYFHEWEKVKELIDNSLTKQDVEPLNKD